MSAFALTWQPGEIVILTDGLCWENRTGRIISRTNEKIIASTKHVSVISLGISEPIANDELRNSINQSTNTDPHKIASMVGEHLRRTAPVWEKAIKEQGSKEPLMYFYFIVGFNSSGKAEAYYIKRFNGTPEHYFYTPHNFDLELNSICSLAYDGNYSKLFTEHVKNKMKNKTKSKSNYLQEVMIGAFESYLEALHKKGKMVGGDIFVTTLYPDSKPTKSVLNGKIQPKNPQ